MKCIRQKTTLAFWSILVVAACGGSESLTDAGVTDALVIDAIELDPVTNWTLTRRYNATVYASYLNPGEPREGFRVATDIYSTLIDEFPATRSLSFDKVMNTITVSLRGVDQTIFIGLENSGGVIIEGPVMERVPDTLCNVTRFVGVNVALTSDTTLTETITQNIVYQDVTDETCTSPTGVCTCGQVIAASLSSEPPDPFFDSIRAVQTSEGTPVIDETRLEDLGKIVVTYYADGMLTP